MPDFNGTTWPQEYQDELRPKNAPPAKSAPSLRMSICEDRPDWRALVREDAQIMGEILAKPMNCGWDLYAYEEGVWEDLNDVRQYEHDAYLDSLDDNGNSMFVVDLFPDPYDDYFFEFEEDESRVLTEHEIYHAPSIGDDGSPGNLRSVLRAGL